MKARLLLILSSLLFSIQIFALALPAQAVDVLIVGAGLSGLSVAYRLKKAGLTYKILEISPHVGGRIRTAKYPGGISAEAGLEEFWEANPTLDLAKELNASLVLPEPESAFSSYYSEGKLFPFTQNTPHEFLQSLFSAEELAAFKRWDEKMVRLYQSLQGKIIESDKTLAPLQEVSFGEWVRKESGLPKKVQEFIRIESEPEYATSWDMISAIEGIAEWQIFSGGEKHCYHIAGGNQKLVEALVKAIGPQNIVFNARVSKFESTKKGASITVSDTATFKETVYSAPAAVSTVPLFRLNEIQFIPPLTPERQKAIQTQTGGFYFTAHVILDAAAKPFWKIGKDSVLPLITDGPLGVIYEGKYDEKSVLKSQKLALLNLLVTGPAAQRLSFRGVAMDDLREELTQALETKWPGIGKWVKSFEFYPYHPRAIASWPVGRSRFDKLSNAMREPQGNIYFAGDFTEGTHSDGAAYSAIRVVKQILARKPSIKKEK